MGGNLGLEIDGSQLVEGTAGWAFKDLIQLGGKVGGFVHFRLHIRLEVRGRAQEGSVP